MAEHGQPARPRFRPGQIIQGQVEALIDPSHVRIRVGEMTLLAESQTELHAGDRVVLRASGSGHPGRFQVVSRKSPGLCGLQVRV